MKSPFRRRILVHIPPMLYGYARVSTDGQSVDAQLRALRAAGARLMFRETARWAQTDRRNATRDYLDLAVLASLMGIDAAGEALWPMDELYSQKSGDLWAVRAQMMMQFAAPPKDCHMARRARRRSGAAAPQTAGA